MGRKYRSESGAQEMSKKNIKWVSNGRNEFELQEMSLKQQEMGQKHRNESGVREVCQKHRKRVSNATNEFESEEISQKQQKTSLKYRKWFGNIRPF